MAVEEFRCINCGSNEYVINEEKGVKKCRYCGTEYEDTENTYTCKRIAEYIDLDQFEEARRICELYLEKEPTRNHGLCGARGGIHRDRACAQRRSDGPDEGPPY